jgi:hypothetical protein
MALLYNSETKEFNVAGIVITLIAVGLLIWLIVYLASPIEDDTCDPPRTHLNTLAVISGYILWGLFTLFMIFVLFIRKGKNGERGAFRKIIPQGKGVMMSRPRRSTDSGVVVHTVKPQQTTKAA